MISSHFFTSAFPPNPTSLPTPPITMRLADADEDKYRVLSVIGSPESEERLQSPAAPLTPRRRCCDKQEEIVATEMEMKKDDSKEESDGFRPNGDSKRKRNVSASDGHTDGGSSASVRAAEIESMLDHKFPSFTKILTKSQGIPATFCKTHLPEYDVTVYLENENGQVHACRYLFEKMGLSSSWRGFSIDDNLMAGDAAVFLLVKPTKFKRH